LEQGVAEGLVGFVEAVVVLEGDDMFFIEAERGILHVVQLLKYDGGADQQYDGDGELGRYEDFAERDGVGAYFEQAF